MRLSDEIIEEKKNILKKLGTLENRISKLNFEIRRIMDKSEDFTKDLSYREKAITRERLSRLRGEYIGVIRGLSFVLNDEYEISLGEYQATLDKELIEYCHNVKSN